MGCVFGTVPPSTIADCLVERFPEQKMIYDNIPRQWDPEIVDGRRADIIASQ